MTWLNISIGVLVVLFLAWITFGYLAVRNIEQPKYEVVENKNGYEIRQYEPYITASVEVDGGYDESLNSGFRQVADYIFGNNTSQAKIAMTVPVQEAEKEIIAMTAPVLEAETSESQKRVISFVMPSQYTLETLPKPNNPKVKITEVLGRKVAALRFSWFAGGNRVAAKKQKLLDLLAKDNLVPTGLPEAAFYNPPLTPPFMRRNEILIPLN